MPILHRLACFRDDVVFLVFLYQVRAAFLQASATTHSRYRDGYTVLISREQMNMDRFLSLKPTGRKRRIT